jgi:hypothetical protein
MEPKLPMTAQFFLSLANNRCPVARHNILRNLPFE